MYEYPNSDETNGAYDNEGFLEIFFKNGSEIEEYKNTIGSENPEKCTSRIGVENHYEESEKYDPKNKIPFFFCSSVVGEESTKKDKIGSHGIRIVENSLKSASIGSFNSMKYRRYSTTIMPCRRVTTISEIEEKVFGEGPFEESTQK